MNLQHPIGKFQCPTLITDEHIDKWISEIEVLPTKIIGLVSEFTEEHFNTSYRPGGWTASQVIHHIYDSHHNSYTRFKWALTEDRPVIKAYYEDRWAVLKDYKTTPVQISLDCLKALHAKWVYVLKSLSNDDLLKEFIHPDGNEPVSLAENIGIYAWHGNHHLAHLQIVADIS